MSTEKICPKCQTEMTEGFLADQSLGGPVQAVWISGEPVTSSWTGLKTAHRERFTIMAFRCPACHYLEFYTAGKSSI